MALKKIFLFVFILSSVFAFAKKKELKYPAFTIPDSLKKNANAVVRDYTREVNVLAKDNVIIRVHEAITILNSSGKGKSMIYKHYDDDKKVNIISAKIYNSLGILEEKVKNSEFQDFSYNSGGALFSDDRIIAYKPVIKSYPVTIEFEYEIKKNYSLFLRPVFFYNSYKTSVENYEHIFKVSNGLDFIYKCYNGMNPPGIEKNEKQTTYRWKVRNLKAKKYIPLSKSLYERQPKALVKLNNFIMDKYPGNQSSWKSLGKWQNDLNKGRQILPKETAEFIKTKTQHFSSDYEKAKYIYEYMQSKTRYVGIQLGIGGWQPFEAQVVDEVGYGDCKALSNYMHALLKVVDIPSYYSLIEADREGSNIVKDFPSDQFNHIVLMMPDGKDTVWMECTSQRAPFGFLGSFTCDRYALAATPEGGKLVKTPALSKEQNRKETVGKIKIDANGNAKAIFQINYKGLQYENLRKVYYESPEDQKKALYNDLSLSSVNIDSYSIEQKKERCPESKLKLELSLRNLSSQAGDRMFVFLNLLNRNTYVPKKMKNRKEDVVIDYAYTHIDSLVFEIPSGYKIESLPRPVSFESDVGTYSIEALQKDGKVLYVRKDTKNKIILPPEKYSAVVDYYKKNVRNDNAKMVLKKSIN